MSYRSIILLVVATLNLLYQQGWLGKIAAPLSPAVTSVTYVYEKDDTAVPNGVKAGIDRVNRETQVRATVFEDDTVDGSGETPDQYKIPLKAALEAGLPSLIATSGDKVVEVVKSPTTAEQVLEAAQ